MTSKVAGARILSEPSLHSEATTPRVPVLMRHELDGLSDSAIVQRIQDGDRDVFGALYEHFFERLWAFAYRYVHTDDVARDVVQDVFLRIWANRAQWTLTTSLTAYLFAATRNRALNVLARHNISNRIHGEEETVGFSIGAPADTPQTTLEQAELAHLLAETIAELPERQRLALTLRLDQEMTQAEIATVIGVSQPAVTKLLRRAGLAIKAVLDEL